MALNKLKKWLGTQAMTAFFDQLNDNVDATNAAIDVAETNSANIASLLGGGTEQTATLQNGWTGTLKYKKNLLGQVNVIGRITAGTIDNGTIIANFSEGYRPRYTVAIGVYDRGSAVVKISLFINDTGNLVIRATADNQIPTGRTVDFEISFNAS